ncbi:hypothetical protein [Streptomyces sp. NPDC000880]
MRSTGAAALQTEHELRRRIADQAPHQHQQESATRDQVLQQARRTPAQMSREQHRHDVSVPARSLPGPGA